MKSIYLAIVVILMLSLSSVASATGTSVSSGSSTTTGGSITIIDQHGSYNSSGNGISLAYSHNGSGSDFRAEFYKTKTNTNTEGKGIVLGSFSATSYSTSAGILSASNGFSKGTSYEFMKYSSHTDVDIDGSYVQVSHGDGGFNYESGTFKSHDHKRSQTGMASVTTYNTKYSNTYFNY